MRFVITTVVLLTLFCVPVHGQQRSKPFQIVDPQPANTSVPNELLYFRQPNQQPAQAAIAPPAKAVNNQIYVARPAASQLPAVPPNVDQRTLQVDGTMSFLGSFEKEQQRQLRNTNSIQRFINASSGQSGANLVTAAVEPGYSPQVIVETCSAVEIRNHCFFGVDADTCCDEWDGFCNCGGLKAHPGHYGQKWLVGHDDPCAAKKHHCHRKHCHHERNGRKNCQECDESCDASPCDDVASRPIGVFSKAKGGY